MVKISPHSDRDTVQDETLSIVTESKLWGLTLPLSLFSERGYGVVEVWRFEGCVCVCVCEYSCLH